MPRILEEIQLPVLTGVIRPKAGLSLYNAGGVIKLIHSDGTEQTLLTDADGISGSGNLSSYYTKQEIDNMLLGVTSFTATIVQSLPSEGLANRLYLVANGGSGNDGYTEYLWINDNWEVVGSTSISGVDLSNYALRSQVPTATSQLTNDSGFLTQHQSLAGYVTTGDLSTYLQVGDVYSKEEVSALIAASGGSGSGGQGGSTVTFKDWTKN